MSDDTETPVQEFFLQLAGGGVQAVSVEGKDRAYARKKVAALYPDHEVLPDRDAGRLVSIKTVDGNLTHVVAPEPDAQASNS